VTASAAVASSAAGAPRVDACGIGTRCATASIRRFTSRRCRRSLAKHQSMGEYCNSERPLEAGSESLLRADDDRVASRAKQDSQPSRSVTLAPMEARWFLPKGQRAGSSSPSGMVSLPAFRAGDEVESGLSPASRSRDFP